MLPFSGILFAVGPLHDNNLRCHLAIALLLLGNSTLVQSHEIFVFSFWSGAHFPVHDALTVIAARQGVALGLLEHLIPFFIFVEALRYADDFAMTKEFQTVFEEVTCQECRAGKTCTAVPD